MSASFEGRISKYAFCEMIVLKELGNACKPHVLRLGKGGAKPIIVACPSSNFNRATAILDQLCAASADPDVLLQDQEVAAQGAETLQFPPKLGIESHTTN